jgi:uncharacterized circularly permuted ATP-grasp superfamily protein/uncharacterized alpha-E superfamily protein
MAASPILESYASDARRFDELLSSDGSIRPHWQPLIGRLAANWPEGARQGAELARQLIVENGVTYNVYADPQGKDRPWALDALPFVFNSDEWQAVERGVMQRAEVLDAMLADFYGPQRLLGDGIVPTELVFGHPNFLPACRGSIAPGQRWLHLYAADLARAPDGQWRVLADRTQTPSGAGYALENREIIARVYPDQIRELGVRPVSRFFTQFRESLLSMASDEEAPLVVVLTSGPLNETYFEHAYLSRQLGVPLVEGSDLTVRDDTVYLKTLTGLKRVHSILRRLDDDFCDPLELRSDSALGIPGLLNAVRARRVVIANGLGSGVLESAAWLGFIPGVAQWLNSEALSLPCVPTWWCGERPALEYVIRHLDRLVVKSTFPNQSFEPVFGRDLDTKARAALLERIRMRPHAYVAQEQIALSQVPVCQPDTTTPADGATSLAARAMSIRVYAIADGDRYRVLPGGLARIAMDKRQDIVSTQSGGGSKDVWVLGGSSTEQAITRNSIARASARYDDVPSRVVENLFWLGRYAERCEDKARLLRATLGVRTDPFLWERAIDACTQFGLGKDPTTALSDKNTSVGLPSDVGRLIWCATQVRSRLSVEHWRTIGTVQRQIQRSANERRDQVSGVDRILLTLIALAGFLYDDMAQDDGWRLMVLGRKLERLQFLCELLGNRLSSTAAPTQGELEWLLEITGSTIAYRSRYRSVPRLALVLDLLVRDDSNAHAVVFQWRAIHTALEQLAQSLGNSIEDTLFPSIHHLIESDLGTLEGDGSGAMYARHALAESLAAVKQGTAQLSDGLSLRHFTHMDLYAVSA